MGEVATPMAEPQVKHPAKFSADVLEVIDRFIPDESMVLDPFAGVGLIHKFNGQRGIATFGVELEPEWAACHERTRVGNALELPSSWTETYDVIATSPVYGNRLSDHHDAKDESRRVMYRHYLGRPLHPANSGQLQWGEKYREFHRRAWAEVRRVLKPRGLFVLNISNHIRNHKEQGVMAWHLAECMRQGFLLKDMETVGTPRMRFGENSGARTAHEYVLVLEKKISRRAGK